MRSGKPDINITQGIKYIFIYRVLYQNKSKFLSENTGKGHTV